MDNLTPSVALRFPLFVAAGALLAVGAVLVLSDEAEATHYRYGTLSWAPTENPNEVCFSGAQAWRASAFGSPAVGSIVTGESVIYTGDGNFVQHSMKVVSYNAINDWMFVDLVASDGSPCIAHTYATPNDAGTPWEATWNSCCRISSISSGNYHVNNPDQSELLRTYVDLASSNSSPKTNLPPINSCPFPAVCTIPVPFVDPDGDTLSFRMSTVSEAGDPGYTPPGAPDAPNAATIDANTGVITWDTTGATHDVSYHTLYSIQVMLEDATTQTPLDFFIELIPPGVEIPYWDPSSACGTTIMTGAGASVQFSATAMSDDPARILTMDHLGLPPGATFPLPAPANPVTGTFDWTPTAAQSGTWLVTITATDDLGYSAPSCPVLIKVIPHDPPTFFNTPCGFANALHGIENVPLSFDVHANSTNLTRTVSLAMVSGPPGLSFTAGAPANPVSGTADWPSPIGGVHTATFLATDSGGITATCVVTLDIKRPNASSLAIGVWAGNKVPLSGEYQTEGAAAADGGSSGQIHHLVDAPSRGVRAEGLEERASTTQTSPTSSAAGFTEAAYVSLMGGQIVVEGFTNEATLSWDGATSAFSFDDTRRIAKLTIGGIEIDIDDSLASETIPLPSGGYVSLFERSIVSDGDGVVVRSNLLHVYSDPLYGAQEFILGSLTLHAGNSLEILAQERDILPQNDAGCGCDAPGTTAGAIPIGPGLYDGSVPTGDEIDTYSVALAHGEKIMLVLDASEREMVTGGQSYVPDPPTPPAIAPATVALPQHDSTAAPSYRLTLFDPTGTQREFAALALSQGPERIELNADIPGDWHVEVQRTGSNGDADNYTLAVTVTPVPLLEQNDALSGADAPGACATNGSLPGIDTGYWPGVLRDDDFEDFYQFEADISELITVAVKPGETADGVNMALSLWDRDCVLIAYRDAFGAQGTGLKGVPESVLELPSLYTGNYYIGIHRINGVGNHHLELNVIDPMPSVPNNDAGSGTDAPPNYGSASTQSGPAFQGQLPEGDSGDAYRMQFGTGREVVLVVDASAGSTLDVRLYTPAGTLVPVTQNVLGGGVVAYRFTPTTGGLFGLEIQAMVGGGDYLVSFAQVPVAV